MISKLKLFALFFLTMHNLSYAQSDSLILRRKVNALQQHTAKHSIEKVHLQLDRPWYGLGDTIWFKAYTVAGPLHTPSSISAVLYTELINEKDSVVNRHLLQLNEGIGKGDFAIPYTYQGGTYRLRAYTRYMRNDSDYFFVQRILIGGLPNAIATSRDKIIKGKPDVQFFPEGGQLVNGLRSKVAFKAISSVGLTENISGTVTDQNGNIIASFTSGHTGMGDFALTPQPGRQYKAKIFCADGSTDIIGLSPAKDIGFTLSVNSIGDSLYVKVAANDLLYKSRKDTVFYLIAQSGGQVYYTAGNKLTTPVFTTQIAKSRFPSGIVQFTLFSQSGEPLNERVAFVQNNDRLKLDIIRDKQSYTPKEKVTIQLEAKNEEHHAAEGSFSLSVTDETKVPVDEQTETTIFTSLLLTSELKGYIENPGYYFTNQNDKTTSDLDLLMLTQGYRRFEWKKILNDNKIIYQPEDGLSLAGGITTPGHKPVAGASVRLTSIKNYFAIDTLTDINGHFTFRNISLPDSSKIVINAKKPKGGDNVSIAVTAPTYAAVNKMEITAAYADTIPLPVKEAFEKAYINGKQHSLKNVIHLKEVNIKDRKRNPVFEPVYSDNMRFSSNLNGPGNADQVVLGDRLTSGGGGSLSEILQSKIFGLRWSSSGSGAVPYSLRASHIRGDHPMTIFIEGAQISLNELNDINPDDVYSVEVLTSISHLSIYGSNAPNGALIITLKHGSNQGWNKTENSPVSGLITYNLKGYAKVREFYSPKYLPGKTAQQADDRKTIYWNPDIITDANGKASFDFFNGGSPGVYRVVVEGIDGYGNLGRKVFRYEVK